MSSVPVLRATKVGMIISSKAAEGAALPRSRDVLRSPSLLIATWFGSGLSPKAPGTAGSLAALPFIYLLLSCTTTWAVLAAGVLILALGTWASKQAGMRWGQVDHGAIVVDEVLGQLIAIGLAFHLINQPSLDWKVISIGFVFFRFFDITKVWPASYFDRHVKNALGVMLDDVAAGVWAGVCTWMLLSLWP